MNDPRTPPHSREAEESLIACCLIDGAEVDSSGALTYPTLKRAIEAGVTASDFYFPLTSRVFGVLGELQKAGRPANGDALIIEVSGKASPEDVYAMLALGDPTKNPTTAHAGFFIEKVRECADKRTAIRNATAIVEGIYSGVPLNELPSEVIAKRTRATSTKTTRVRHTAPPTEPQPRLFLAKKPVCTPGNLTTIISRAKTGKTATLGAAVAAIIAAHNDKHDLDTLGFSAPHTSEAVILVDTEQSPYDAWVCHDRAIKRSTSPDPDWLHHHAMVGFTPKQLRDGLLNVIAEAKAAHGGIFTIILDGVADFVCSVNDEAETKEFIAWIRTITVTHNCPCICVIHSNEGVKNGDDGRGHLGKELTRKSESNLLLKKIGEITTITSEKQRKAPITEADGISFQWSDELQRHVSCASPVQAKPKGGKRKLHDISEFLEVIPAKGQPAKPASQLHRYAIGLKEIKLQTFKDLLNEASENGVLTRHYSDAAGFTYVRAL